ncbi:hypothetical protein A616_06915 [Brevibacillus brevis X23]|nr:hypothetical protein A616_06915 [Brevibacillus brevis X23]
MLINTFGVEKMYFSSSVFIDNFERLRLTVNDGKKGIEQTTGLATFLAVDMAQKETGQEILNLHPENRQHRERVTSNFVNVLCVGRRDGIELQVNNLGMIEFEQRKLDKKFSSNVLTTPVKRASETVGTRNYPSRPAPLLTLGLELVSGNKWGVKKLDNWTETFMTFFNDRLCGQDTFPLIVYLLRDHSFGSIPDPSKALIDALQLKFTSELSDYLVTHARIPDNWDTGSFFSEIPISIEELEDIAAESEEPEMVTGNLQEGEIDNSLPKNLILFGPPGTGKTFRTAELALRMCGNWLAEFGSAEKRSEVMQTFKQLQDLGMIEFVTFHQSIAYEEFVEGINAKVEDGAVHYIIKDGIFKEICSRAEQSGKNHILIIDEINRANISKVFGELITLIEEDKRAGELNEIRVRLPYSQQLFSVPSNLYIIGTMNTVDRSIALMDVALRRRFEFEEIMPQTDLLGVIKVDDEEINLSQLVETINKRITILLDRNHTLGQAIFMRVSSLEGLISVMKYKLLPLLQEYFYGQWDKIGVVLGDNLKEDKDLKLIVEDKEYDTEKLLGKSHYMDQYDPIYTVNPKFGTDEKHDIKIIKSIYE